MNSSTENILSPIRLKAMERAQRKTDKLVEYQKTQAMLPAITPPVTRVEVTPYTSEKVLSHPVVETYHAIFNCIEKHKRLPEYIGMHPDTHDAFLSQYLFLYNEPFTVIHFYYHYGYKAIPVYAGIELNKWLMLFTGEVNRHCIYSVFSAQ